MSELYFLFIHPATGAVHTTWDVMAQLGMNRASIYERIKRGDRGFRLWRPKGAKGSEFSQDTKADTSLYTDALDTEQYIF